MSHPNLLASLKEALAVVQTLPADGIRTDLERRLNSMICTLVEQRPEAERLYAVEGAFNDVMDSFLGDKVLPDTRMQVITHLWRDARNAV